MFTQSQFGDSFSLWGPSTSPRNVNYLILGTKAISSAGKQLVFGLKASVRYRVKVRQIVVMVKVIPQEMNASLCHFLK